MSYANYWESEYRVFSLYRIMPDGSCECEKEECKAVGKHPRTDNWQHTPDWSDEQIETMDEMGQFATGFGVLVHKLLVVDVDARNGGVESYAKLCADLDLNLDQESGFVVTTGSGGGSKHVYFTLPESMALMQHHNDYPGIDFKSSGYVVGAGSHHKSGGMYESESHPSEARPAPQALVDVLTKVECHRAEYDGQFVDVTDADVASMLNAVDPDSDHETWIRCGMAVHEATDGKGFDIWDAWSAQGEKYPGTVELYKRWNSFGNGGTSVTLGTLVHYATAAGWQWPIEFESDIHFEMPEPAELDDTEKLNTDFSDIDLNRPPGFVGEVTAYLNSKCKYPREKLAVGAALMVVSCAGGLRHYDKTGGTTANLFIFGVAGSATGKDAVITSAQELLGGIGVAPATHGWIKSEQEIVRNLLEHRGAFHFVDELGEHLSKTMGARKGGGAAYLEGIVGKLMEIFGRANKTVLVTGDVKKELKKSIKADIAAVNKELDANPSGKNERRLESLQTQLNDAEHGIRNPYMSIFGTTTPTVFDTLMDVEMSDIGLIGRSLIFRELDNNPRGKRPFTGHSIKPSMRLQAELQRLYSGGHSELPERVDTIGEKVPVETTKDGVALLDQIEDYFHDMSARADESTGLTPIPRRAHELVSRVSMVLGMPSGLRTTEHIRWAFALIDRDVKGKMNSTNATRTDNKADALMSRVMSLVDCETGMTIGVIRNKCRSQRKEDVDKAVELLVEGGHLELHEVKPANGRGGRPTKKYFAVKG